MTNSIFSILYRLLLRRVFHSLWLPPLINHPSTWQTHRIILPYTCKSHGDVRLHFPSKPHLRILGRSSSTQKTTSWPCKFPLRFRTVSQSAWTESKITSNHDDLSQIQVLSRTADRREKAHMAMKCIKQRRNAAWMQESRPRLLHYPLCHILF